MHVTVISWCNDSAARAGAESVARAGDEEQVLSQQREQVHFISYAVCCIVNILALRKLVWELYALCTQF